MCIAYSFCKSSDKHFFASMVVLSIQEDLIYAAFIFAIMLKLE